MGSVEWPTARGSKGKGSQERRNAEKLVKGTSMTAVLQNAAPFRSCFTATEVYSGNDKDGIVEEYIEDRSLTHKYEGISFNGTQIGNLLVPGNPFVMPQDFKVERKGKIKHDEDTIFRQPKPRRR